MWVLDVRFRTYMRSGFLLASNSIAPPNGVNCTAVPFDFFPFSCAKSGYCRYSSSSFSTSHAMHVTFVQHREFPLLVDTEEVKKLHCLSWGSDQGQMLSAVHQLFPLVSHTRGQYKISPSRRISHWWMASTVSFLDMPHTVVQHFMQQQQHLQNY